MPSPHPACPNTFPSFSRWVGSRSPSRAYTFMDTTSPAPCSKPQKKISVAGSSKTPKSAKSLPVPPSEFHDIGLKQTYKFTEKTVENGPITPQSTHP